MNDNGDPTAPKRKRTGKITVDNPNNMDLETYIANYKGHTKIDRLIFIAERCPSLQFDAYKHALAEIKANTFDLGKYGAVLAKLNEAYSAKGESSVASDFGWVDTTQKKARSMSDKLEAELKNYKNNLIKESIRMGHNDLGDHYYNCGDLNNALKCYSRTRDYCTTAKHIVDMCLNVIKVSIELGNFSHIHSYVVKAEGTPDIPEKNLVTAKLKCAQALAHLDGNNVNRYKQAAKFFLETSFELGSNYSEVISPNDVAVYGGLCALASFDRADLKSKVIDNQDFKSFLELEPHIRELIHSFYHSRYKVCLQILDDWKNDFLLDYHLHNHVETLYDHIRRKALIQYFSPFLTVDLVKMATSFSTDVQSLERELARLIRDDQIQARIDSHKKILHAKQQDQRSHIFEKSLSIGADYEKATRAMLLRINLIKADMVVRLPKDGN